MAESQNADVRCNECSKGMSWGMEYQLPHGTDHDAICSECKHEMQ